MKNTLVIAACLVLSFAGFVASAQAQGEGRREHVFAGIAGSLSHGYGDFGAFSFDQGFGGGGGFALYGGGQLIPELAMQAMLAVDFHDSSVRDLTLAWHTLELKFAPQPAWAISPYVVGGVGFVLVGWKDYTQPVTSDSDTDVRFTFSAGLGARCRLGDRFSVEPEIRVRYLRDKNIQVEAFPLSYMLGATYWFE